MDSIRKKINLYDYQNLFFTKIKYDNNLKGDVKLNLDQIEKSIILVTGFGSFSKVSNPRWSFTWWSYRCIGPLEFNI